MDLIVTPVVIHLTRLDPAQEGFEPRNVVHLELTTAFTRDINMEVCLLLFLLMKAFYVSILDVVYSCILCSKTTLFECN